MYRILLADQHHWIDPQTAHRLSRLSQLFVLIVMLAVSCSTVSTSDQVEVSGDGVLTGAGEAEAEVSVVPAAAAMETESQPKAIPPCTDQIGGTLVDLTPEGAETARAWDINESGDVVGQFRSSGVQFGAIWWADGTREDIELPTHSARGINDHGVVVGLHGISGGLDPSTRSFVRSRDGELVYFELSGAFATEVDAINNQGVAVGRYYDSAASLGGVFIRKPDGTITTIELPGTRGTVAINNQGQIAGTYSDGFKLFGYVRNTDATLDTFELADHPRHSAMLRSLSAEGVAVGWRDNDDGRSSWIRPPGATIEEIEQFTGEGTLVGFVNTDGVLIGTSNATENAILIVRPSGEVIEVESPGAEIFVTAANDSRQVAGVYLDENWPTAYRWDPPCSG